MVNRFQMLYFSTLVRCKPWEQRNLLSARKNKTTNGNCHINLPTGLVYLHMRNMITFIWRFTTIHKDLFPHFTLVKLSIWFRYVDNLLFCGHIWKTYKFLLDMNPIRLSIQFIMEKEYNDKLPFSGHCSYPHKRIWH